MQPGRDHYWHDLMKDASPKCAPAKLDAEHPLFILYTSGTTGKPKGILHTTGGYLTHVTTTCQSIFDLKDTDVYWCTADVGWITGHSYIVYGPLANGAKVVMYEGAPPVPGSHTWSPYSSFSFWMRSARKSVSKLEHSRTARSSLMPRMTRPGGQAW